MRRWIVLGLMLAILAVGLLDRAEPQVVADARATLSPDEETAQVPTLTAAAEQTAAASPSPSQTVEVQLTATLTPTCNPGPLCTYLPKIEGPPPPPTAEPTLLPTEAPSGLYVDHDAGWIIGNDTVIAGEVVNPTNEAACYVQVTARLYDAGGNVVALKTDYTVLTATTPYQRNPFAVRIYDTGSGWDTYSTSLSQGSCFSEYRPVTVLSTADRNVSGGMEVFGEAENQTGGPLRNIQIAITYFDPNGDVITADWDLLTPSNLAPGARGTYSSPVYISNIRQLLGRYAVQAQGYVSSTPLAAERAAQAEPAAPEVWERHP